jgi:hypothetical protein
MPEGSTVGRRRDRNLPRRITASSRSPPTRRACRVTTGRSPRPHGAALTLRPPRARARRLCRGHVKGWNGIPRRAEVCPCDARPRLRPGRREICFLVPTTSAAKVTHIAASSVIVQSMNCGCNTGRKLSSGERRQPTAIAALLPWRRSHRKINCSASQRRTFGIGLPMNPIATLRHGRSDTWNARLVGTRETTRGSAEIPESVADSSAGSQSAYTPKSD